MKKVLCPVLFVVALSSLAVGCGGEKSSQAVTSDGKCTESFLNDRSDAEKKVKTSKTTKEMRGHLDKFQSDYAGVKCKDKDGKELNTDLMVSDANKQINELEATIKKSGGDPATSDVQGFLNQEGSPDHQGYQDYSQNHNDAFQQQVNQQNFQQFMDQSGRDHQNSVDTHQNFVNQNQQQNFIDQTFFPNF